MVKKALLSLGLAKICTPLLLLAVVAVLSVGGSVTRVEAEEQLDESGNVTNSQSHSGGESASSHHALGEVLNSFPNPSALRGLTFRGDRLWGVTAAGFGGTGPGQLFEMDADTGAVLSTLSISPSPPLTFGLGFDTSRDVFIVTDPLNDEIVKVDPATGAVVDSFPSPGSGPVGTAYDSTRDGYWISDFNRNAVDLVNPGTGAVVTTCSVSGLGASRIAGTGYSVTGDVILFNSRDDANTYVIRASDCSSAGVFPTPPSPGLNNGQGAAIRPADLTGYLSHFEDLNIFVVELELIQLVDIDIKPGGDPNPIKLSNKGVIPVAVLASDTFDVTDADVTTLEFGPSGGIPAHDLTDPIVYADHLQDVNGDGFTDLVSHYRTQGTGISAGDTEACLTGEITGGVSGVSIAGCDSVRVKSK